jgi:phosphoribosylglycinamide formyltransferase-1
MKQKIAIFASGSGSNAENIMSFAKQSDFFEVALIISNKRDAFVLERAQKFDVKALFLEKNQLENAEFLLNLLNKMQINTIVLAGYLKLIPSFLIDAYPNRIINIHPALLPKYGGKGMYGHHVHEAVVANQETETGISIHYVNEKYDEGQIIFQATCKVDSNDTADDVASKIHELEMDNFPSVIENLFKNA